MSHFIWQSALHPVMALGHLLVLLALGLCCAQQGKQAMQTAMLSFIMAIALGLFLTRFGIHYAYSSLGLLVLTMVLALLVSLKLANLALVWSVFFALLAGLLIGLDSAFPFIPGMKARTIHIGLFTIGISSSLLLLIFALLGGLLNKLWSGLAVRVLGAWIAAAALMVLALSISGVAGAMVL